MAERYQSSGKKSTKKFEVMGSNEVAVRLPLPLVEVWEELQPEVEHLTGLAGLKIIRAVIEDEVMRRVGPRHQPDAASSCLRWGQQPGYVVFAGQKVAVQRPRVRTRQGEEVQLDSYARLQHDGRRQRAVREGIVAGLTSRNYHRAVDSVLSGYGIEKSSVSRQFVQASAAHSLEEGLEETLTVHRLGVGTLLRQTLASSNPIESCLSTVERVARNVKRWRAGDHALRWTATGLLEAEKKFRRVKGYRELEILKRSRNRWRKVPEVESCHFQLNRGQFLGSTWALPPR